MNLKQHLSALACTALIPGICAADTTRIQGTLPVDDAIARVTEAVEAGGAQVFLVMDYAMGGASAGVDIPPSKLILFGSPKIGATAVRDAPEMGLFVPLRLLAYEAADGTTWLVYPDAIEAATAHGLQADHPAVQRMQAALQRMAMVAAGG